MIPSYAVFEAQPMPKSFPMESPPVENASEKHPMVNWSDDNHPAPNVNKALPKGPTAGNQSSPFWNDRSPLTTRPTNLRHKHTESKPHPTKTKRKTRSRKKLVKSSISRPLLHSSSSSGGNTPSHLANDNLSPIREQGQGDSIMSTQAVADLESKLGELAVQRESKDERGQQGNVQATGSTSTLQRGRNMLGRVKGVLQSRLRSNSPQITPAGSNIDVGKGKQRLKVDTEQANAPTQLSQSGPVNVLRKPVPARTSSAIAGAAIANSRPQGSKHRRQQHGQGNMESQPTKRHSRISLLFDRKPDWFNTARPMETVSRQNYQQTGGSQSDGSGNQADVSDNNSMPALDLSPSSPKGFVTPRLRLESRVDADGRRRMTRVRSDTATSFLGIFDFEMGEANVNYQQPMVHQPPPPPNVNYEQQMVQHQSPPPPMTASEGEGSGGHKRKKSRGVDGSGSGSDLTRKKIKPTEHEGDQPASGRVSKPGQVSAIRQWALKKRTKEERHK